MTKAEKGQNKPLTKSLCGGRFVVIGEGPEQTTWPGLTERLHEIVYGIIHTQEPRATLSKDEVHYLANVVDAYKTLVYATQEKRNRVCAAIKKEAEKIGRTEKRHGELL